jgi:hypothetical protein
MIKRTIYTATLIIMLSCNKKAPNIETNTSSKENLGFSKNLSKTGKHSDSISKESLEKKDIVLDTISVEANDLSGINKTLNGVWNVVNTYDNKPDNIIGITYHFNSKSKTLETYLDDELREVFSYEIVTTNCEINDKNPNSYSIKLSGDGIYCSEIIGIKHKNNKVYLILKDDITELLNKEFLKK